MGFVGANVIRKLTSTDKTLSSSWLSRERNNLRKK